MVVNKLTILIYTIDGIGHLNVCIGIGEVLRDRGHSIIFCIPLRWKGQLEALGFQEEIIQTSEADTEVNKEGENKWGTWMLSKAHALLLPTVEHHKHFHLPMYEEMFSQVKNTDKRFREIMSKFKPDVVIVDTCYQTPALIDQGVPWILSTSFNPLGISNVNVPPAWSGYAANSDPKMWNLYNREMEVVYKEFLEHYNTWMVEHGAREQKFKFPFLQEFSPWANMYVFPKELDYTPLRPNPPNWYQFDSFMKRQLDQTPFEIPTKIARGPGKLIYFSMGTIGSVNAHLMQRLISILAKSPNRFIISKGSNGDQLDLADNMWGQNSVPQTKVIPLVDLVITHGGNNTLTESFYYGKRLIVLPLIWDQMDNAQRMHETGLGLTFHPCKVTENELLQGIETLLDDDLLDRRMRSISQRIQASDSKEKAADLVERVGRNVELIRN